MIPTAIQCFAALLGALALTWGAWQEMSVPIGLFALFAWCLIIYTAWQGYWASHALKHQAEADDLEALPLPPCQMKANHYFWLEQNMPCPHCLAQLHVAQEKIRKDRERKALVKDIADELRKTA